MHPQIRKFNPHTASSSSPKVVENKIRRERYEAACLVLLPRIRSQQSNYLQTRGSSRRYIAYFPVLAVKILPGKYIDIGKQLCSYQFLKSLHCVLTALR